MINTTTNLTKLQPKQKRGGLSGTGFKTLVSKNLYGHSQGLVPKNIGQGSNMKKGPKNCNQ